MREGISPSGALSKSALGGKLASERHPTNSTQGRGPTGALESSARGREVPGWGLGAVFVERREAKSSVPGSPWRRRQDALVPQAASWTAAPGSEALGEGCTGRAARTPRPAPSPHGALGRRSGRKGSGARCGQPPSARCRGPQTRAPGLPRLPQPLPEGRGSAGTRRGEGARRAARQRRAAGRGAETGSRRADRGRREPYLGERREAGAPPGFGAHSPGLALAGRPGRAPLGRPLAGSSAWGPGRSPRGAPTAAAAGLAGRGRPKLRPPSPAASAAESPPSLGEKKKTPDAARGLWCVGRGSVAKSRGGSKP